MTAHKDRERHSTSDNTAYTQRANALALWDIALFGRNFVYAGNVSTHPKRPTQPTINLQKRRTKMPTLRKLKEVFCQSTCGPKNTTFNFAQPYQKPTRQPTIRLFTI